MSSDVKFENVLRVIILSEFRERSLKRRKKQKPGVKRTEKKLNVTKSYLNNAYI